MRLSRALALLVALLPAVPGICGLDASVLMQYAYEAGVEAQVHVTGKLLGMDMGGGVPVAITGSSEVDVTLRVVEVDQEGTATVRISFGKVESEFMGQAQEQDDLQPLDLKIDKYGRAARAGASEGAKFDLLASGGMPRQIIAMLGATVALPEEGVAPGETWTIEGTSEIPDLGQAKLTVSSRLVSLDAEKASFVTTIRADLPDFTTPNPIQEGEIEVKQGQIIIEEMTRTVSLASGLVETAQAQMVLNCRANLGGYGEVPLTVNSSFEIKPVHAVQQARRGARAQRASDPAPRSTQRPPDRQNPPTTLHRRVAQVILHYVLPLLSRALGWWDAL